MRKASEIAVFSGISRRLARLGTSRFGASLGSVAMLDCRVPGMDNRIPSTALQNEEIMSRLSAMLWLLVGIAVAGSAAAQDGATPAAPSDDGRYSFHRSGDSFIRLDSRTGQVSQCGWSGAGWACKMVPDERAALESEIVRLQRDNAELKKSLLAHGIGVTGPAIAEAPPAKPVPPAEVPDPNAKGPKLPGDAELDRAFAFMKNVWRRLVDLMADLQRDIQKKI